MTKVIEVSACGCETNILGGAVCCFGVFDGVHRGHRFLIRKTIEDARKSNAPAVIITFDIDPDEIFASDGFVKLMSNNARIDTLASYDVDYVVTLPFTMKFAAQEPLEFLDSCFSSGSPLALHVGYDFHFGSKNLGDVSTLKEWGSAHNMRVEGHNLKEDLGEAITATRIRTLLASGTQLREANELLGHEYRMEGRVEEGRKQGREMGFRTANVFIARNLRALAPGVYAAYANVGGSRYKAAVSVGVSPTFADETEAFCEAHILDFDQDIYGAEISLDIVEWLRPMKKFDSLEVLIETVMGNIEWVRANL